MNITKLIKDKPPNIVRQLCVVSPRMSKAQRDELINQCEKRAWEIATTNNYNVIDIHKAYNPHTICSFTEYPMNLLGRPIKMDCPEDVFFAAPGYDCQFQITLYGEE